MFTINAVNIVQISLFSLCTFGLFLLFGFRQYRYISVLFVLVMVATLFNLLEELGITRDIYLVTPIFVLGFGPAIYLSIKGMLGDKLGWVSLIHFLPMFLLLPFTSYPGVVIAIGTGWRLFYAGLSFRRLLVFRKDVLALRSDAEDLSLGWLMWALAITTFVSMLNLIRLNFQLELGPTYNLIGQGFSTLVSLVFFAVVTRQLVLQQEAFAALNTSQRPVSETSDHTELPQEEQNATSDVEYYHQLFDALESEIKSNQWFQIPRLTLSHLSELSGLQTRDISRAINIATNKNFNDYINQLRLQGVVKNMEEDAEQSLLNLAIAAGFNSKSTFNQAFKKHYSVTPQSYRNARMR